MDSNRILWIALAVVSALVAALLFQPTIEQAFLPVPAAAFVAIEVEDSGVAVTGPVDLEVGQTFRLHAVLEATDRQGESVWYTDASSVRRDDRELPPDRLRPWRRRPLVKVRWFSVEGLQPVVEVPSDGTLERFELRPFVRSDWPLGWSVAGEIEAAHDDALRREQAIARQRFGTLRFKVQIETYEREEDLLPKSTIRSAGVEDLLESPDAFPMVRLRLPGPLGPASEVFGLTQIEVVDGDPEPDLRTAIEDLARLDLAFSRFTVLRAQIRGAGLRPEDVVWSPVESGAGAVWDRDVSPGDLLRAGDRVVVLWQDEGVAGELDDADLCFDYVEGAAVRRLADVFTGEGRLEVARLGPPA